MSIRSMPDTADNSQSKPTDLRVWRDRRSWEAAAVWLNREGLAAAVPPELVLVLERQGLIVWAARRWVA